VDGAAVTAALVNETTEPASALVKDSFPDLKVIPGKAQIPNDSYGAWMKQDDGLALEILAAPVLNLAHGLRQERCVPQ
jgi:hypothetical protein